MMEWIVLFVVSWVLFILLKGWKRLWPNILCGLAAVMMQLAIDSVAMNRGLYEIRNPVLEIWGSSVFFCFGPVFVIATLLSEIHPANAKLTVINVIIVSLAYSAQEYLLMQTHELVYSNWALMESVFINFIIIISLSWISVFILGRGGLRK